jgi:transketolase
MLVSLQMEQLKQLREWGSVTPGHPERQVADGIEVTTGACAPDPTQAFADSAVVPYLGHCAQSRR